MKATFRVLRRALTASVVLGLAIGLGSWQFASAQEPGGQGLIGPGGPGAGPAVAGPQVAGPQAAPAPIGPAGDGPVADGPAIDAPPPGPALQHHFVHIMQIPGPDQQIELRTELMLFVDGSFKMVFPQMPDFGDGYCEGHEAPADVIGVWDVRRNRLVLQYSEGYEDFGLVTMSPAGPVLRFDGRRWTDLLSLPAPDAPPGPDAIGPAPIAPAP